MASITVYENIGVLEYKEFKPYSQFPSYLDTYIRKSIGDSAYYPDVNRIYAAIQNIQIKLGVDGSGVTSSLDYLIKHPSSSDPGHKHPFSKITDITATASEINAVCDGATATAAELNAMVGAVPWIAQIDPLLTPDSQTNWNSFYAFYGAPGTYTRLSTGAINAEISWPVVLSVGTWTFWVCAVRKNDFGIMTVYLNGVSQGTIDLYWLDTSGSGNYVATITGISISTPGLYTLKLKMTSKNASSSNYYGAISQVTMFRTS